MFICEICGRQMTHGKAGQVHCFACGRTDSTLWKCAKCQVTFEILPDGRFRCGRCGCIVTNPDLPQKKAKESFFQMSFNEIKELLKDVKFGLAFIRSLRRF